MSEYKDYTTRVSDPALEMSIEELQKEITSKHIKLK